MNETLSGKGYIQGDDGVITTSDGKVYGYHDGKLTLAGSWGVPA